MTKNQVKLMANAIFKKHTDQLKSELEALLQEADMWYGEDLGRYKPIDPNYRNGDLLALDGPFDNDTCVSHWLSTRKDLGLDKKGK